MLFRISLREQTKQLIQSVIFSSLVNGQAGTPAKKVSHGKWLNQAAGAGPNSWDAFTGYKMSTIELKEPDHWPFKQNQGMAQLLMKMQKFTLKAFDMPFSNVKISTNYEANPITHMISVSGPKDTPYNVNLCVNTNIVMKETQVEIHTKVTFFVECQPTRAVSFDKIVETYLDKKLDHKAALEEIKAIAKKKASAKKLTSQGKATDATETFQFQF